nr:PREDICTED: titin-like [Bemisia tabaci]
MEALLPSEVARLVYGYLEAEKCPEAALLFLQTSQHLKECHAFYLQNRRFSTKVMGLTLLQCLDYLCSVYRTVQSHLCTFENDPLEKLSLPEQLDYLLNSMNFKAGNNDQAARVPNQVDPKTPEKVATSPFHKMAKKSRTKNASDKATFPGSSTVFTSFPFPVDDDVGSVLPVPETTSLESLPGNTRNRRKSPLIVKNDDFFSDEGSANQTPVDSNRFKKPNLPNLTNLFLDKPDLCSKISININKALNFPDKPRTRSRDKSKDIGKSAGEQLDTAIKSLVNQLVDEDPVFDDVLAEIIDQLPTPAPAPSSPNNTPKVQEIPKSGTIPEINLAHGDVLPTADFGNGVLPSADLQPSSQNAQNEICPSNIPSPQKTASLTKTCSTSEIGELQKPPENIMQIPKTISMQPASAISSQIPASHLPEQLSVNCAVHSTESSTPQLLELTNMQPAEVSSTQPLTISTVAVTGSSAQPVELSRISPLQVSSVQPVQVTNSQRVESSIIVLAEAANLVESQQLVMQTADGYYSFIPTSTEVSSTVSSKIITNNQHGTLLHFGEIPAKNEFVNIAPKPGSTNSTNFVTEMQTTFPHSAMPAQMKRSRSSKEPRQHAKKKKEATGKLKEPLVVEVRILDAAKDARLETSSDSKEKVTAAESYRQLVEAMSFVGDERSATPRKTPVKSTNLISVDSAITPSKFDLDPNQTKPKEDKDIPVEIAINLETAPTPGSNLPKIETAENTTTTESASNCGVEPIENRIKEKSSLKTTDTVSAVTVQMKTAISSPEEPPQKAKKNKEVAAEFQEPVSVEACSLDAAKDPCLEMSSVNNDLVTTAESFRQPVESMSSVGDERSAVPSKAPSESINSVLSGSAITATKPDLDLDQTKPKEDFDIPVGIALNLAETESAEDTTTIKSASICGPEIMLTSASSLPITETAEDTTKVESPPKCGPETILASSSNLPEMETAGDTEKINSAPNCGPETTLASASNLPEMETAEDTTKIDSASNCAVVSIENRTEKESPPKMTDTDVLDEINPKTESQIEFATISPLRVPNNHRQSLSTPRRKKNHVRVLDFGTPQNFKDSFQRKANTSPKALKSSEPPSERIKSIRRGELFQSPETSWYLATTPDTVNHDIVKPDPSTPPSVRSIMSPPSCIKEASPLSCQESVPPPEQSKFTIATRSPQPRLSGGWDKINGLGLIVSSPKSTPSKSCDEDSNSLSCSKLPVNTVKPTPLKESWDHKLRAMLRGDYEEPEPPKKQTQSKSSPKKSIPKTSPKKSNPKTSPEKSNPKTSLMSKAKVIPKKRGQKKKMKISPVKVPPKPSSSSVPGRLLPAKEKKIERENFPCEMDLEVSQSKVLREAKSETISVIDPKLLQNPVIQICKSIQPNRISDDKSLDMGKFIKKSKSHQDQENTTGVSQEKSEETSQFSEQLKSSPKRSNPKTRLMPKVKLSPKKSGRKKNIKISPVKISPRPSSSVSEANTSPMLSSSSSELPSVKTLTAKGKKIEEEKFPCDADSEVTQSTILQEAKSEKIAETNPQIPRPIRSNRTKKLPDASKFIKMSGPDQDQRSVISVSLEKLEESCQFAELKKQTKSRVRSKNSNLKISAVPKAISSPKTRSQKKNIQIPPEKTSLTPTKSVSKLNARKKSISSPERSPLKPQTARKRKVEGEKLSHEADSEVFQSEILRKAKSEKIVEKDSQPLTLVLLDGTDEELSLDVSKLNEKSKSYQDQENTISASQEKTKETSQFSPPKKKTKSKSKSDLKNSTMPKVKLSPKKSSKKKNILISPAKLSPAPSCSTNEPSASSKISSSSTDCSPVKSVLAIDKKMEGEIFSPEADSKANQSKNSQKVKSEIISETDAQTPTSIQPNSLNDNVLLDEGKIIEKLKLDQNNALQEKSEETGQPMEQWESSPEKSNPKTRVMSEVKLSPNKCRDQKTMQTFPMRISPEPSSSVTKPNVSPTKSFSPPELSPKELAAKERKTEGENFSCKTDAEISPVLPKLSPHKPKTSEKGKKYDKFLDAAKVIEKPKSGQDAGNAICAIQEKSRGTQQFLEPKKQTESKCSPTKSCPETSTLPKAKLNPNKRDGVKNMKISPMIVSPAPSSSDSKPNASTISSFPSPVRPLSGKEKEREGEKFSCEKNLEVSPLLPKFSPHGPNSMKPVINILADEDIKKSCSSTLLSSSSNVSEQAAATTENQATQDNFPVAKFSSPEILNILQKAESEILLKADSSIRRSISSNKNDDDLLLDAVKFIDESKSDQDQTNVICASQKKSEQTCQFSEPSVSTNKREESIIYTPKESLQNIIYVSSDENSLPFKSDVDHKANEEFLKNYGFCVEYEIDDGLITISTNTVTEEAVLLSIPSVHDDMTKDMIKDVYRKKANQERDNGATQILKMGHASDRSLCAEEEDQSSRSSESKYGQDKYQSHTHGREKWKTQKSLPYSGHDQKGPHERLKHKSRSPVREAWHGPDQKGPQEKLKYKSRSPVREAWHGPDQKGPQDKLKHKSRSPVREAWHGPDQKRPHEKLKHKSRSPVREARQCESAKFIADGKGHHAKSPDGRHLCDKNSLSEDRRSSESFSRSQRSWEGQRLYSRKKPICSRRSPSPEAVHLNERRSQHRDPLSRFTSSETRLSCKEVHTYNKSRDKARHSSTSLEVRDYRERNRGQDHYFPLRKSPIKIIPLKHQHRDFSGKSQSSGTRQSPKELQMHSQSKYKVCNSSTSLKDQDIRERNRRQDHYPSSRKRALDGDRHSNYLHRHTQETKSSGNGAKHRRSRESHNLKNPDFSHQQKLEVTHETETTTPLEFERTDPSPIAGLSQEVIMGLKEKGLYDDYVKYWKLKESQRQQEEKMSPDDHQTLDASKVQNVSASSMQDSELEDGEITSDSVSSNFGVEANSRYTTDEQDLDISEYKVKRRKIVDSSDENTSTSDLPVKSKHEAKNLLDTQDIDMFLRKIHPPEKEGIQSNDSE